MKVLQVINSLNVGGAEKLLLEIIPKLNAIGITTDLLVFSGAEYPFLKKLKELDCCTIHTLGTGSVYSLSHIFKLQKYLKQYDLVHVHLFPAQYFVVLAKILSRTKTQLIFTEHNTTNRRLNNPVFSLIDRKIYPFYNKVVCISEEIKSILKKHTNLSEDRLVLIHNGVDLSAIKNAKPLHRSTIATQLLPEDKLLIQVAGFREQKDQPTLIKAMQYLDKSIKLLLVGDGVLKTHCEALVAQLQLSDNVFFLGLRMDVPQLLKTADVVVLSSHYEGLSLSSIEGMSAGKPFVASNVPGLKEIVSGAGVLVTQGKEQELALEINKLLTNEEYYHAIASSCMERAKQYDISKMVASYQTLYKNEV